MTTRDEVWSRVLLFYLVELEPFKRRELGFPQSKRHTVQRVLGEMEYLGWLRRERPQSGDWMPGVVAHIVFGEGEGLPGECRELELVLGQIREEQGPAVAERYRDRLELLR